MTAASPVIVSDKREWWEVFEFSLDLCSTITEAEIKDKFKVLSRKLHPDRNNNQTTAAYTEVVLAREAAIEDLKLPLHRRSYHDAMLKTTNGGKRKHSATMDAPFDVRSFASMRAGFSPSTTAAAATATKSKHPFFSGSPSSCSSSSSSPTASAAAFPSPSSFAATSASCKGPRSKINDFPIRIPENIILSVNSTHSDVYNGQTCTLNYTWNEICETCMFSATSFSSPVCAQCRGSGLHSLSVNMVITSSACNHCNGSGLGGDCTKCNKTRTKPRQSTLKLTFDPRKMYSEGIVGKSKGHEYIRDGKKLRSDVYYKRIVDPNPPGLSSDYLFDHNTGDIALRVEISLRDALTATQLRIPLSTVVVHTFPVKQTIDPFKVYFIRNAGLYVGSNVYIIFRVRMPKRETLPENDELLRDILMEDRTKEVACAVNEGQLDSLPVYFATRMKLHI